MSATFLIASGGDYLFDTEALIRAMEAEFPGTEVHRPTGDLARYSVAFVYLPELPDVVGNMEVDVQEGGGALSIEGARTAQQVADFVAWVARTAPVPDDGSVVLIEWADDLVPLRPDITAEEILAARP